MSPILPTTWQVLLDQGWIFPDIFERTPEATSIPRPQIPGELLGEGTGGTVYKRQLRLPRCNPPCPKCPVPQVCAVKRLGRNSVGHVLHAHDPERRQREKEIMSVLDKKGVRFAYLIAESSSLDHFWPRNGIATQKTLSLDINLLSCSTETMRINMVSFTLLWSTCPAVTLGTTFKSNGKRVILKFLLNKSFTH